MANTHIWKGLGGGFLLFFTLLIFAYNFHLANNHKYEAYGDAREYVALGTSLAKTGKYGFLDVSNAQLVIDFASGEVGTKAYSFKRHSTWRPPGWPVVIAGVFKLLGYKLIYLIIFKFLLLIIGGMLFYKTLLWAGCRQWLCLLGAFVYLVHPASQLYSRFFLSEPLTLFVMTVLLFLVVKSIKLKTPNLWIGIVSGVLILCHPYFVFFPFCLYGTLWLFKKETLKWVVAYGIITISIVSIWVVRNAIVLETTHPVITTSSGAVMAKGWNTNVVNEHSNTKGDLADESIVLEGFDYDKTLERDEVEMSRLYTSAIGHFIKTHPEKITPIVFTKLRSAFNPIAEDTKPGVLEVGRQAFHLMSLICGLLLLLYYKRNMAKPQVLALFLSTIAITIISYSGFRFRMPQSVLELLFIVIVIQNVVDLRLKHVRKSSL